MTAIVAESILNQLENNGIIPNEQKDNRRKSRSKKDQLFIDKMILRNAKRRKINLHVTWIDCKKLSTRYFTAGLRKAFKCLASVITSERF